MQKTPKLLSGFLAAWPLLSVISVTAFAEGNRTVTATALCTVTLQTGDCGKVTVNSTDYTGTTDIRNKAAGRASCRFSHALARPGCRSGKTERKGVCDKMPSVYLVQVLKMRRDVIIGEEKLYNRRSVCYTLFIKLCHAVPSGGMGAKRKKTGKKYGGNHMKKRLLSILLCLVMALSLLPTVAFATSSESYYYWSNDNNMVKHDSAPTDDRGYAYYDGNTSIELNNFQYNYSKSGEDYGDYALFDVTEGRPSITVTLIGDSNIEQSGSGCIYFVKFDKNIEITSEDAATLNITGRSTSNTYEVFCSVQDTTATATVSGKATVNISCTGYGLRQGQTYVGGIAFYLKNLILTDSASISVFGDFGSVARRWTHDSVLKFAEGYNATVKMGDSKDSATSCDVPESGLTVKGCYLSVTPNVPVTPYPVWVGDTQVTSANKNNILSDSGTPTATYDPESKTLTLNGYNGSYIYADTALNIVLADGTKNKVSVPVDGEKSGICTKGDCTLSGNGDLDIYSPKDGIYARSGNLTIDMSGDLSVSSGLGGLCPGGYITISGSGDIVIDTNGRGLWPDTDVTVSGSGNIKITADYGIDAQGKVIFSGSRNIIITARHNYGITAGGNVEINDTCKVSVDAGAGYDAVRLWNSGSKLLLNGTGAPISLTGGTDYKAVYNKADANSPVGGTNIANYAVTGAPDTASVVYTLMPSEYTVTVENDGHGTASANKTSAAKGETVTLTATPATGYHFKEWQSSDVTVSSNNTFTMPEKDVTVKAIFEADTPTTPTNPDRPDRPFHPGRPTTPTTPTTPTGSTTPTGTTSPKSGDSSNMMLWAMLAVMSGAALCGAAVVSKKRKHN